MNNNNYWYNIKEENGSILIEKTVKEKSSNEYMEYNFVHQEDKKRNWRPVFIVLPLLIIIPFLIVFLLNTSSNNNNNKYRTFMIYMVGSDLESSGKIASFDLKDINGSEVDLENNNVLLMVGGSKKWHNFVKEDEVGLYQLTNTGFKKVKTYELSSMGSSETLAEFINYSTKNYKSEKYDFIFWNHGLAAVGLEDDEVFDDFIDIEELDNVFNKSRFSKDKLELIIFNNCMSGNIHIASIMKKYANYMVASEEVMYVGSLINRLDFLSKVKKEDNGYDIGLSYIKQSDKSISVVNNLNRSSLDSTLSIIDLSKIDEVEKSLDDYFEAIDIDKNYKAISRARRITTTYGDGDYTYDTVDLYTLVDYLDDVSTSELKNKLQESIKSAVVYNSSLNEYSNGLAIYFPYYGPIESVSIHMYLFDRIWDNEYTNFIHKYVDLSTRAKRSNRAGKEDEVLTLTNDIKYENNKISLELTDKEKEIYQSANIYIFEKGNDIYKLLLKSDDVVLDNNRLLTDDLVLLETANNEIISAIKEKGLFKIYGLLNESDVVVKIENNHGFGIINKVLVDSKDKPVGGLVDYSDENILYYSLKYNGLKDNITEEWNKDVVREELHNKINDINFVGKDLTNYYALIELHDINNDVFYSKLTLIK